MNNFVMVAVGAIIEDGEGRVLLVKHVPQKKSFWQGKWICPGGKLQHGEEITEGIKREVNEETNLEIELVAPLVPFDRVVKEKGRIKLHVIYIDYLARLVSGDLRPGDDVGEAIWVEKKELPGMWNELHEDTQRLFQIAKIVDRREP